MSENKKPLLFDDHKRPVTRRDFLATGMIDLSLIATIPSLVGSMALSSFANADECGAQSGGPLVDLSPGFLPFLVVDLAGGAGMPGNFLVGGRGGPTDLLSSYSFLGWNPRQTTPDSQFGLPMAGDGVSRMLQGILNTTSAEARARFRMGSFCHVARDDTAANTTSALIEVAQAGLIGNALSIGLGIGTRFSGGNTGVPREISQSSPLQVNGVDDVLESFNMSPLSQSFSSEDAAEIVKATLRLSQSQAKKLASTPLGKQFGDLLECGFKKNIRDVQNMPNVDARKDVNIQEVYGINENTASSDRSARIATVVMNVLQKTCGPSALVVGGCDYHNGTQTTGDSKDLEIGETVGRAIESAHRLQKPLVMQILTDGGVSSRAGSRVWSGEAGDKCMTVLGVYHPDGAIPMKRQQVGSYTDGQSADMNSIVGRSTSKVAYATLANYLHLCGKLDLFRKVVDSSEFPHSQVQDVLLFDV